MEKSYYVSFKYYIGDKVFVFYDDKILEVIIKDMSVEGVNAKSDGAFGNQLTCYRIVSHRFITTEKIYFPENKIFPTREECEQHVRKILSERAEEVIGNI